MINTKVQGLYRLFRVELSFSAGICVVLGELLALGSIPSLLQAVYGFLSFFFISAAALILNDYFDVETDRINAPSRPLPAGLVTTGEALILSVVVTFLGLFFSAMISGSAFAVALGVWSVGFLYNRRLKKSGLWGNLFVAFSVGMTFIFGGIVVDRPCEAVVWYLAATVFFIDLGEDIAADCLDLEGDRTTGSRSLAVILGPQRAMRIATGIFGIVVAGSVVPFVCGWLTWIYLPPLLIWDVIILVSARNLLDHRRSGRLADIRRIYLSGLGVMVVFIIMRLAAR